MEKLVAILCIEDELDVHDDLTSATLAMYDAHETRPEARIGLAFGDERATSVALQLRDLARPGQMLWSGIAAELYGELEECVELGHVSFEGYADRWAVFELEGATTRERSIVAVELVQHVRMVMIGEEDRDSEMVDHALDRCDRCVFEVARTHRGFVERFGSALAIAFDDPADAFAAARRLVEQWHAVDESIGYVQVAIDHGELRYLAGRWLGAAMTTADRLASVARYRQIAVTRAVRDRLPAEVGPMFDGAEREELAVKGRPGRLEVFRVRA